MRMYALAEAESTLAEHVHALQGAQAALADRIRSRRSWLVRSPQSHKALHP